MGNTAPMSPCVIAIVGHSGAGKTTLIERLLPVLLRSGLAVATIKHSHHQVELDIPARIAGGTNRLARMPACWSRQPGCNW